MSATITWSLKYGGTTKSFAAWKLTRPRRHRISQGISTVALSSNGEAYDADQQFAQGSTMIIYRISTNDQTLVVTTTQWFVGRVEQPTRFGSPQQEGISYLLVDCVFYLAETIYQIYWKERSTPGDPNSSLINKYLSEIFLNKSISDTVLTTRQQIQDALQYCLDTLALAVNGSIVPFQFDASEFTAMNIPIDKIVDAPCLAVIIKQLRFMPDATMWVDYATTVPTIHIKRRAAMSAVSINVAGKPTEQIEIRPRYDLQRPCVAINFRVLNNNNGTPLRETVQQIAPGGATGREFRAVISTVNLEGFNLAVGQSSTNTRTTISAAAGSSGTDATRLAWWKARLPWLSETRIANLSIVPQARDYNYTYELATGSIPYDASTHVVRETIKALATYDIIESGKTQVTQVSTPISVEITSTDATANSYSTGVSGSLGEAVPSSLASNLYDGISFLPWEGKITLAEQELSSPVSIGNKLNLTGGRTEWTTMNAVIQQVEEDMETGKTTITFGPPAHLGIPDLIELLRFNSQRVVLGSNADRASGAAASAAGTVSMPRGTPVANAQAGFPTITAIKFVNPAAPTTDSINVNPVLTNGHAMYPQEKTFCVNGTPLKAMVLMSDYY